MNTVSTRNTHAFGFALIRAGHFVEASVDLRHEDVLAPATRTCCAVVAQSRKETMQVECMLGVAYFFCSIPHTVVMRVGERIVHTRQRTPIHHIHTYVARM